MHSMPLRSLDLFCGIGGLTRGLEKSGVHSLGGIDIWEDACKTFEHNLKPLRAMCADITKLDVDDIETFFKIDRSEIDILVGGPPCQGFSTVGKRDASDPRNFLWKAYFKLVEKINPSYVLIENVEGLLVMNNGHIAKDIIQALDKLGYKAHFQLLKCADYGIPQLRKRVIFLACKRNLVLPNFPEPTSKEYVTVKDAIFDLPPLNPGEKSSAYFTQPFTDYQRELRGNSQTLFNHEAAKHPAKLIEILKHIPDGGNRKSIPDKLQPTSGFHNSYARLASNKPALAVTSNMRKPSSARTTHPVQHRGLTVREGLRLQTFDDEFIVLGTRTSQYLQVGNAVPPKLAELLGKKIIEANEQAKQARQEVFERNHTSEASAVI